MSPAHIARLPAGFRFGTCTSAYQVEGAVDADGRGASVWDTFCGELGRIADGSTGAIAADHYHRMSEDVGLLGELGAGCYRFSIAWPRVLPDGRGAVNQAGLDFYDRLVDALLERGVAPMATLHHFDLPQALEADGGWLNRATTDAFEDYATLVGARLADRVDQWVPIHKPTVTTTSGYAMARYAPGKELDFDAMPAAHHQLLAHGRAVQALRAAGARQVGCSNQHAPIWPASDKDADLGAAKLFDSLWNAMYVEPMLLGRYPDEVLQLVEPAIFDGDLARIHQPLDFYGVGYDCPFRVGMTGEYAAVPFALLAILGYPTTDRDWAVVPEALREWLISFRARYRDAIPPIYLTDLGCAYSDGPGPDGVVDDQRRIDYLRDHIDAVAEAIERGVDVRGCYVSSLLDGFEWSEGYSQRYGLVHVDFESGERTKKASFAWYAAVVAAAGHREPEPGTSA